jgi:type I site-specific restriction endonuclease
LNEAIGIGYHLMKSEVSIPLLGGLSRADIVVYNANGRVEGIVECKAPQVEIDDSVLQQANKYHYALSAQWVVLTNGLKHVLFEGEQWKEGWPEKR